MTHEQVNKGHEIIKEIERIEADLEVFKLGASKGFLPRQSSINILGTRQDKGFAMIPKAAFKAVCYLAKAQCEIEILELKQLLNDL